MKFLLYNPNTTVSMTVGFTPAALHAAAPTTEVIAETAAVGPASIEGYYDEALCVPPMLHRFSDLEQEGFDAAIIAMPKKMPKTIPKPLRMKKTVSRITAAPIAPFTQSVRTLSFLAPTNISPPQNRLPRYPAERARKAFPPLKYVAPP